MGKQNRLIRRGGSWTFRVRVPERLRTTIGKRELWKSLGRVTHTEAARLARIESVKADALFNEAERRLAGSGVRLLEEVTDAELASIARAYFFKLENSAEPVPFSAVDRLARQEEAEEQGSAIGGASIADAGLQAVACNVGEDARLSVYPGDAAFLRLVEAVQRALVEHYGREADRLALTPERVTDPLFADVSRTNPPPDPNPLKLKKAIELFKAAPERAHVAEKTRAGYEFRYAMLIDLLGGDAPVATISRADMRDARDLLLRLPANAQKRFPGKNLQRVATLAEEQGIPPMSPKSVTLYMHAANALFRWLVTEELAPKNPAAGLKGPALPDETERRPFTVPEMNRLFAAPAFNGKGPKGQDWLYWLPRLALFTGARFAELLALRRADLTEVDGVMVFSIAPNDDRRLKNKGSKRLVPVHPELIKLGLLDYAEVVPADGLLFPDAAGPEHMVAARNKEIGRKLRALLLDDDLVFHSFRHTFKDAGQRARIPRELLAAIGGWEVEGGKAAMDGYGRDPLVRILNEELAKVTFAKLVI